MIKLYCYKQFDKFLYFPINFKLNLTHKNEYFLIATQSLLITLLFI
jgi:hypothetical protein